MTGKTITRTAWDDTKGSLALGKGTCNLVYGSVSAHSYYDIYSRLSSFFGENRRMTSIFGKLYFYIKSVLVYVLVNKSRHGFFACCTGYGVYDENYLLHD